MINNVLSTYPHSRYEPGLLHHLLGAGSVGKEKFQEIQLFKPQPGKSESQKSEFQGLHAWALQATVAASGQFTPNCFLISCWEENYRQSWIVKQRTDQVNNNRID